MGVTTSPGTEGVLRLSMDGAMTIYDAAGLRNELLAALGQARELEVDLEAVDEMDTAGAQLLLMAWKEATRTGRQIRLLAVSDAVTEVLDRYRLWPFLGQTTPSDCQ